MGVAPRLARPFRRALATVAIAAMAAAIGASTVGLTFLEIVADWWDGLIFQIQRLFS